MGCREDTSNTGTRARQDGRRVGPRAQGTGVHRKESRRSRCSWGEVIYTIVLENHLGTRTRAGLHWHLITPLLQPVTITAYQSSPACSFRLPPARGKPVTRGTAHASEESRHGLLVFGLYTCNVYACVSPSISPLGTTRRNIAHRLPQQPKSLKHPALLSGCCLAVLMSASVVRSRASMLAHAPTSLVPLCHTLRLPPRHSTLLLAE